LGLFFQIKHEKTPKTYTKLAFFAFLVQFLLLF